MIRAACLVLLLSLAGCVGGSGGARVPGPYQPQEESARDPRRADSLNAQAAALMESDPAEAERLLRDALTADLFHGPAHNNLGVLLLGQDLLFSAASEFEWARRLMPQHPDPRMNLALTLERAGRTADALSAYTATLEAHPEHVPTMQAMARLQVRSGRTDDRTPALLVEISSRGASSSWRDWARRQLTRVGVE